VRAALESLPSIGLSKCYRSRPATLNPNNRRWSFQSSRQRLAVTATAVVILIAGGLMLFRPWAPDVEPAVAERLASPLPEKPSIAVLPLANLTAIRRGISSSMA
jgi:hypothetical protein